jgi:MtN3 and saliva related transmembrane protein
MESTEYIGIAAGICTSVSQLPQLIKIIREKKADDISYCTLIVLITGLAGWVWYGCMKSDWPIILTNSFSVLVNMFVIFFTIRYKK